jgi:hypothetical protein
MDGEQQRLAGLGNVDSWQLARDLGVDVDAYLSTHSGPPHSVFRLQYWRYKFVAPTQPSPCWLYLPSMVSTEPGILRRFRQYSYEEMRWTIGYARCDEPTLLCCLFWAMGCFDKNGLTRHWQKVWSLGVWYCEHTFINSPHPQPVTFWNDMLAFDLREGRNFGTIMWIHHDKNYIRALAQVNKRFYSIWGSMECCECRVRKSLLHFTWRVGKFYFACRWCHEEHGLAERTGESFSVASSRLGIGWQDKMCFGHPICGHCYYKKGYNNFDGPLQGPRFLHRENKTPPPSSPTFSIRSADWEEPYYDSD